MATTFMLCLTPNRNSRSGRAPLRRAVKMDDTVHLRVFSKDDPLGLATYRRLGSIGNYLIWSGRFAQNHTNFRQFVEVYLALGGNESLITLFAPDVLIGKMPNSRSIEWLVCSLSNTILHYPLQRGWNSQIAPWNTGSFDHS